jgi:uncharacterized membrane protein YidH (DUF202 family)
MSNEGTGTDDGMTQKVSPPSARTWLAVVLVLLGLSLIVVGRLAWWAYNANGNWSHLNHWWLIPVMPILVGYGCLLSVLQGRAYGWLRSRRQRQPGS